MLTILKLNMLQMVPSQSLVPKQRYTVMSYSRCGVFDVKPLTQTHSLQLFTVNNATSSTYLFAPEDTVHRISRSHCKNRV